MEQLIWTSSRFRHVTVPVFRLELHQHPQEPLQKIRDAIQSIHRAAFPRNHMKMSMRPAAYMAKRQTPQATPLAVGKQTCSAKRLAVAQGGGNLGGFHGKGCRPIVRNFGWNTGTYCPLAIRQASVRA